MRKSSSAFFNIFCFFDSAKPKSLWYNDFYETFLRKENVAVAYRVIVKCGGGAFFVPNEAAENLKLCTAGQHRVLLFALSKVFPKLLRKALPRSLE